MAHKGQTGTPTHIELSPKAKRRKSRRYRNEIRALKERNGPITTTHADGTQTTTPNPLTKKKKPVKPARLSKST